MTQFSLKKSHVILIAIFVLFLGVGAIFWLRAAHVPAEPIRVAQAFIRHLEAKQFEQAHQLTLKNGYVGKTTKALEEISGRELCTVGNAIDSFPFQSNGNRLRRWAKGVEIEMPEVQVEFEGDCLLGVTVRRTANNEWRVFKFAAHAG